MTLPRPDELRRLAVYSDTDERAVAVGVAFPSGPVVASLASGTGPVTFGSVDGLLDAARSLSSVEGDVWASYEDRAP